MTAGVCCVLNDDTKTTVGGISDHARNPSQTSTPKLSRLSVGKFPWRREKHVSEVIRKQEKRALSKCSSKTGKIHKHSIFFSPTNQNVQHNVQKEVGRTAPPTQG
jgi:hypothetical protein